MEPHSVQAVKFLSLFVLAALLHSVHVARADEWDDAEREIKRAHPNDFPELPKEFAKELEEHGCLIPQHYAERKLHNVISGEFARKGQKDWAALCSTQHNSLIIVHWGGASMCLSKIAQSADRQFLQGTGNGIGYSRAITAVGEEFIVDHHEAYGGPAPPEITHEGIDDAFVGKASVVRYCHDGKWLQLTGAD